VSATTDGLTAASAGERHINVKCASLIGHSIECFDFYIYATAAVLVFPRLFFPTADPTVATLQSLATFALAFLARPIGSVVFGHLGDRIGRKSTLIATLLTMGLSTVAIGLLPTYAQIGLVAPLLLGLCRFGQGVGLGGEWAGSMLLAVENAPPGRQAWYGMFPQLGSPVGFFLANGLFLLLAATTTESEFLAWGWRVPFLASGALVLLGLWMRIRLRETPAFTRAVAQHRRVRVPVATVFVDHSRALVAGLLTSATTFVLFYLMTVFALTWGTGALGFQRASFLRLQLGAILAFALTIPISALLSVRLGSRPVMFAATTAIFVFGFAFSELFSRNSIQWFLVTGLALMGLMFGSLSTTLARMFPTQVRYTGASLAFNLAGIVGASMAPYLAVWLASQYGLRSVGYYLSVAAALSLLGLWLAPREVH
jgi:metabolite-proton symporter